MIVGEDYFAHPNPAETVQDAIARRIGSVGDRSRAGEPFAHRLGDLRGPAECVGDPLRRGELVGGSGISHQRPAIAYDLRKKLRAQTRPITRRESRCV